MLDRETNDLVTRVGPGTPCGNLLRRYWHPVAVAAELTEETPKKRVRILGEDLVLFRLPSQGPDGVAEYGLPDNRRRGRPRRTSEALPDSKSARYQTSAPWQYLYYGLVFFFDTRSGLPLAIINDGYLQHARVAASRDRHLPIKGTPVTSSFRKRASIFSPPSMGT